MINDWGFIEFSFSDLTVEMLLGMRGHRQNIFEMIILELMSIEVSRKFYLSKGYMFNLVVHVYLIFNHRIM